MAIYCICMFKMTSAILRTHSWQSTVFVCLRWRRPFWELIHGNLLYKYCQQMVRKESLWQAFLAFSQQVQMNYTFTDYVHILCPSCNLKKSKTTAKFYSKEQKQDHLMSSLHCFLLFSLHESGTRRLIHILGLYCIAKVMIAVPS